MLFYLYSDYKMAVGRLFSPLWLVLLNDAFLLYFFPSVILPLPQNVKDYLLDDGTLVVSGR
jgi:hypothetical protein